MDRIRTAYHDSGELEAGGTMARAFLLCVETGQNVPGRYIAHVRGIAQQAGYKDLNDTPELLWRLAADSFDWRAATQAGQDDGRPAGDRYPMPRWEGNEEALE
jgi:hypothetical protein